MKRKEIDRVKAQCEMLATIKKLTTERDAYQRAADALAAENKVLREAARLGFDWIDAQPQPRMIGAAKAITALKEALGEQT